MRSSLVPAALLCFTTWMNVVHATHAPVSSCCLGWSDTKVNPKRIVNYTFQTEGVCSITAVVFHSKQGASICSDPKSAWAKNVILKVDKERKQKTASQVTARNEEGLTSDDTPTVSLPLKTTPKKKGRNGRRRQKKKSRGRKRGQKKSV
ncbi:C-C motif chemokine 20-like [Pseudoliparis swirei]|uniref:C-C motif chemokine 20-like n=1 Tax=Pseudoliparis swirei TaxID=2059687 RepID=UPI0024BE729F|nr:C-C motif chemokine 20-like [Pseudoliparis swirei]